MPEYLSPAVYVEEVDSGAKPIEGVSTSTAGTVGVTERGPVGVPILVTSFGEYQRLFGEFLNELDYPSPHNFFPHAIEGFFTNLGQRVYVVRVLDTAGAVHANTILYDRGSATSADTVLLRSADAGTGPAGTALLYVLDATSINIGDWLRIGNGTPAEYRQVAGTDTDEHVSFDLPLMQSHDAGVAVQEFSRAADGVTYAGPEAFSLDSDVAAGAGFISVTNAAAADIAALAAAAGQLIAVGDENSREEYRFVVSATVDPANANRADVELDEPLALSHASGVRASALALGAVTAADNLETPAAAGTPIVFLTTNGSAAAFTQNSLIVVDGVEVRRIGDFGAVDVSAGAYESYGRDVVMRVVATADTEEVGGPPRALIAPAPAANDTQVNVDDMTGLEVGHAIRIDDGANVDDVFITNITPGVAPAGVLGFEPPLQHGYAAAVAVVRIFAFRLTQEATAGGSIIAVDRRADIADGQLLRIGNAPDDEYIRINDIPDHDPGFPPDDGNIVLDHAARNTHTTGTIIYVSSEPTLTASRSHASMTLAAAEDDETFHISDGGAAATLIQGAPIPDLLELTSDVGERFYHRVVGVANPFTPAANIARIELNNPPLARSHGVGNPVLGRDTLFDVQALDAGIWGNRIRIAIADETQGLVQNTRLQQANVTSPVEIRLESALGVEQGTILEFSQNGAVVGELQKVDAIDRRTGQITIAGPGLDAAQTGALAGGPLDVRSREFQLIVYLLRQPDAAVPTRDETVLDSELFRSLSMDPRHSRYFAGVIGDINGEVRLWDRRPRGESQYIRVSDRNPVNLIRLGPESLVDVLPSGRIEPARRSLLNGFDSIGTLTAGDFVGVNAPEPEDRTGIQSLRNYEDVSIVAAPGQNDSDIQRALIEHCEEERFRFAVLDGPAPPTDTLTDVLTQRQLFDTKYAALYHPWLLIDEPFPANLADIRDYPIPPAGHVMGVYARTDVKRGVHKSPANEVVRGISGLQRVINKREHDLLNPYPTNINVIRDFRDNNRGIRVWGGRVITSDVDWKYVNVRRLLIFIEHSIERGLQWVVFEPNSEPTWARVRRAISNFLTVVWRNGALEGTSVEEAYFVKCDRTTMTQTDIDNGRLICQVGVAPVKPAEFVIIRIGLWTAHADTE